MKVSLRASEARRLSRKARKTDARCDRIGGAVEIMKKFKADPSGWLALIIIGVLSWGGSAAAQDDAEPDYSGEDIYALFCIVCHGPRGQGSPLGKPLDAGAALALSDAEIIDVVYNGRPDKGMMGFGTGLTRAEIEKVAQYVRELQGRRYQRRAQARGETSGPNAALKANIQLGEKLFAGKAGCMQCHSYYTRGGFIGPALDTLALRLTAEEIREAVTTPAKTILENYGSKEIVTEQGQTLRGRFRYETEDTVQLLNTEGTIWTTYFKKDLESVADLESSLMPEGVLSKLSKNEQDALFAFLGSLK